MNDEIDLWYGCDPAEMLPTRGSLILAATIDTLYDLTTGAVRLARFARKQARSLAVTPPRIVSLGVV